MSFRKPLVRFDSGSRAQLVSSLVFPKVEEEEEDNKQQAIASQATKKTFIRNTKRKAKRKTKTIPKKQQLKVIKGQLLLKVPGYKGQQKVQLSKLVPYLPKKKLIQAAKRALVASGLKGSAKKNKRKKASKATSLFNDG